MIESSQSFFTPKEEHRLHRLEQHFVDNATVGQIDIFAIAHDWAPESIVDEAVKHDVVTLELTRGVVQAGLSGESTSISRKNVFWQQLVDGLRPVQEGKLIRGVAVNQTARVAYKRLASSLTPDYAFGRHATVEVTDPTDPVLGKFLNDEDLSALLKYNWINTDDQMTAYTVFTTFSKSMDMIKKGSLSKRKVKKEHKVPLSFPHNIHFLLNLQNEKKDGDEPFVITFFKSPDRSLVKAYEGLIQMFSGLPIQLDEDEERSLSKRVILGSLLASAELTEAKEVLNALYQRTVSVSPTAHASALHIGGAFHAQPIKQIIDRHVTNKDALKTNVKDDPRFDKPINTGSLQAFLRDVIPFEDRIAGASVEGYEAIANPDLVHNTKDIVQAHLGELEQYVAIERAWINLAYGLQEKPEMYKLLAKLSELSLDQLQKLAQVKEEDRETTVQSFLQ